MNNKFNLSLLIIFFLIIACSGKEEKVSVLKEKNLETQMIEVYSEAMAELERGDVIYAGKKFSVFIINFNNCRCSFQYSFYAYDND